MAREGFHWAFPKRIWPGGSASWKRGSSAAKPTIQVVGNGRLTLDLDAPGGTASAPAHDLMIRIRSSLMAIQVLFTRLSRASRQGGDTEENGAGHHQGAQTTRQGGLWQAGND